MENNTPKLEENVKTSSAAWLGAANTATGLLCAFAEGSAFQYLFVNKLGLDTRLNLIVMILFGIWNALNDPIYGFLADHTHSKLGRRRPWIRYGAPVIAIIYALMWITFTNTEKVQWFLFLQEFIGLFLFDIVYTAIASAIYVMPYEMAVTNKARNKIFLWNIGFSVISYGVPMVANSKLDEMIEKNYSTFIIVMAAASLIAGAIIFISTFFYKENNHVQEEKQPKFFEGLKLCLKNKSFLLFEVVSWTVIYAQSALMVGLTYLSGMWANENVNTNGWIGGSSMLVLYLAMLVGLVLGLLLFVFNRDKWGTRVSILISVGTMALGCTLGAFLGKFFIITLLTFFCCGVGLAGGLYLVPMINGDVIDKDEIDNGSRREGVYAGINSLITKPAGSIAVALLPFMLETFFMFNKDLKVLDPSTNQMVTDWMNQSQVAHDGLFFSWLFITAVLLILSVIAMWFYPLHGKKWNEAKQKLSLEHQKKQEEYEQEILKKMQEK